MWLSTISTLGSYSPLFMFFESWPKKSGLSSLNHYYISMNFLKLVEIWFAHMQIHFVTLSQNHNFTNVIYITSSWLSKFGLFILWFQLIKWKLYVYWFHFKMSTTTLCVAHVRLTNVDFEKHVIAQNFTWKCPSILKQLNHDKKYLLHVWNKTSKYFFPTD
jgi:hypothetical protein